MVNIDFLVVSYFISLFIDWVFQWQWQAVNKSNWVPGNYIKAFIAVMTHSAIYSLLTTFITITLLGIGEQFLLIFFVLFISHMIIDTRIPVKLIMKFKGLTKEQIHDYVNYGFMHIGIDHRLHEIVLVILAIFVK